MPSFNVPNWKVLRRAARRARRLDDSIPSVDQILDEFLWVEEVAPGLHEYRHKETGNSASLSMDMPDEYCLRLLVRASSILVTWQKVFNHVYGPNWESMVPPVWGGYRGRPLALAK